MRVVLVHHAEAVGPDVDLERPLSARGVAQAEWLAGHAKAAGLIPAAIWHSGRPRARQTAEWFRRTCNPSAEFRAVRGLCPDDSPEWMRDLLEGEERDVLIVSHMPLLPALALSLDPAVGAFPLHGLVVLERTGERRYVEQSRTAPKDG